MKYIGSCADDSIGVGYILRGTDYRRTEEGLELFIGDQYSCSHRARDGWIACYDVMQLEGEIHELLPEEKE